MPNKHYVGEAGTSFILDTGVLIGTVTEQYIKWRKPSGLEGSWAASLYSSYSELASLTGTYLLSHTLGVTDLTEPGMWRFQAYVGAVDGTWYGETVKISIYDKFE